jgi:hypothetical protein
MENLKRIAISLGNTCRPAEYGVCNGLRDTKINGYKTCPFDLMVSNYNGVVKCIQTDFVDFCNPDYLVINNDPVIYHTKYGFQFNHETPGHADLYITEKWEEGSNHFINNDYRHFIERYNNRINSFRNYLNDSNNYVIFIITFFYEKKIDDDYLELRQVLREKYPLLKYEILEISSEWTPCNNN